MDLYVLTRDRHNNVAELNWLMEFQPFSFDNWISMSTAIIMFLIFYAIVYTVGNKGSGESVVDISDFIV